VRITSRLDGVFCRLWDALVRLQEEGFHRGSEVLARTLFLSLHAVSFQSLTHRFWDQFCEYYSAWTGVQPKQALELCWLQRQTVTMKLTVTISPGKVDKQFNVKNCLEKKRRGSENPCVSAFLLVQITWNHQWVSFHGQSPQKQLGFRHG